MEERRGKARFGCFSSAVLVATIVVLALPCSSALAVPYSFIGSFGTPGQGDGQFELDTHSGVAVNHATHDVYVADTENHRVVVFDSAGSFIRAFGADVGGAGIDVCTTACVAGTSESAPGAFEVPTFIAIDNNPISPSFGDVYVADNGGENDLVSKFEADGTLVTSWGAGGQVDLSTVAGGPFAGIAGIAVDLSGNLFVYENEFEGFMFKFTEAGTFVEKFNTPLGSAPQGIAVDSTGDLYKVRGTKVVKMGPGVNSSTKKLPIPAALVSAPKQSPSIPQTTTST